MKKILSILIALIVLGIVAALALAFAPFKPTPANEALAADWKAEPGRGEYGMRAGDCMACHTAKGGEPMAGGRGIESPMGTIWSSNITPDKETGIGNWTLDQFRAAGDTDDFENSLSSIRALISVVNSRDLYTFGHTERVVYYASLMAKRLHLSRADSRALLYGAYVHDVGKINVAKEILLKPIALTDEE